MNAQIQERRRQQHAESVEYAAKRFGVNKSEIVGYNSGCCYDRVIVKSRETAEKIAKSVEGRTVNGGMFHGMPLGAIQEIDGKFDVMI